MISSITDTKQLNNLVSKISFTDTKVGDFVMISDMVKLPIFSFDHSGQFDKTAVLTTCNDFINLYLEKISDLIMDIETYNVRFINHDLDEIQDKFMELVSELCERSGKYKSTYDLMYQLTHYVSTLNINLRVGLKNTNRGHYEPTIVASLTMDARNKLDKKLDKTLELDTLKIN